MACRHPGCSYAGRSSGPGESVLSGRALGREEPERVEVRAGDPVRLHDRVGARRAQPQRVVRVPGGVLGEPVHHRPLVQPEAAELGAAPGGRGEQPVRRVRERAPALGVRQGDLGRPVGDRVALAAVVLVRALERDAEAGVPAAQLGGPLGVVGEEEVVDRVLDPVLATGQVRGDERVDAVLVAARTGPPHGRGEHLPRLRVRRRPHRGRVVRAGAVRDAIARKRPGPRGPGPFHDRPVWLVVVDPPRHVIDDVHRR